MNPKFPYRSGNPFATLRRLAQPRIAQEHCELCSLPLANEHRHLLEMAGRKVICACDACAMRFEGVIGGKFKLIPRRPRALPNFQLADEQWESLALPINLAFLLKHSPEGKIGAYYPSPAGATSSLLSLTTWEALVAENPVLDQMEPDVEALLVNRVGSARDYFLAPIDVCYELVGLIRVHWRGLSGGDEVWEHISAFFKKLQERAEPCAAQMEPEANHA
ncbi:MAG TPA: DUF5947 family protein [Verrucomicrobiae bacterium]|nr:DUF5947 family protein [Verrucomicrobiae bacterium]